MRILILIFCTGCLLLVPLAPAVAAESRKELGLRLDAAMARIMVLEDRMLTGDPAAVRLSQRLDGLERQLREQIGENERLRFENARHRGDIDGLRKELDLLNADVRSARDEAASAKRAVGGYITGGVDETTDTNENIGPRILPSDNGSQPYTDGGLAGAEQRFAEARYFLESGFFDEAYTSLTGFLGEYPGHDLAGEALFWRGEIQMVRGNPVLAAEQYLASLKQFRKGTRAPDAMVKLAAAFAAMGDLGEACQTLKLFPKEYPKASAAVRTKADIESRRANCSP